MKLITDIIIYCFLGAIQGLTEPIPVSSSGHLVIFKSLFSFFGAQFPTGDIYFEVIVNTGSLLAIMFYYREDLIRLITSFFGYIFKKDQRDFLLPDFRYCMLLIVATIPAAIGGVLFNDMIDEAFQNVLLVGFTLLITGTFLMIIHKGGYSGHRTKKNMNLWDALRMGCFQLFALLPGVSRSGSTITGGMIGGLNQKDARDFSFFMFMPVSLGAIVLKLKDIIGGAGLGEGLFIPYLLAFVVSGIVTYYALILLFKILDRHKMNYFAYYCYGMGTLVLVINLIKMLF